MAKDKLVEYDATAANNTVVGDVNLAENSCLPSDLNNAVREVMSHQKEAFGAGTPLYVDQTNNRVGIGTASPTASKLQVDGTDGTIARFRTTSGSNNTVINITSNDSAGTAGLSVGGNSSFPAMTFENGGSEKMRLTSAGRLGLGTSSPSATLDVNGPVFISPDTAGKNTFRLTSNAANDANLIMKSDTTDKVQIQANGDSFFNGGNVGIGTATPAVASGTGLQIHNATSGAQTRLSLTNNSTGAASSDGMQLVIENGGGALIEQREAQHLGFATSATERMRLTSAGLLGLGTSAPSDAIHIKTTADADIGLQVQNDDTQAFCKVQSGGTALYGSNGGVNFVSGSGYATRMHIASGGNVGINEASPDRQLHVNAGASNVVAKFESTDGTAAIEFTDNGGSAEIGTVNGAVVFFPGGAQKGLISSDGTLLLNQSTIAGIATATDSNSHEIGPGYMVLNRDDTATVTQIAFGKNGSIVGGISTTGSATSLVTSSDRRLKSNIQDAASASDKIDALQVRQFDWNVDGSHQDYGLVAQELQPIEPMAVSGSEDGDEMMGVDYSKLVPMLLKEIQELRSRVATLEAS